MKDLSTKVVGLEFVCPNGTIKAAVTAEIADTPERRRRGLSKRASLPAKSGMFFDKAGSFWMKDVNFPLDLVFVDINGKVLQKHAMAYDPTGGTLYRPDNAYAAHAIEVPHGFIDRHGITPGDRVRAKGV